MVVQSKETKASSSLIDLLGGNAKNKNSKVSDVFAQLLSSLGAPLKTEKNFNVVVDPKTAKTPEVLKSNDTVKERTPNKASDTIKLGTKTLEDLLGNEETKMLPKELIDALSNDQVRSLIHKAKEFLKESIVAKSPEYKADSKELPKTLMGLVELADKVGVNLSEITLSTLDDAEKPLSKELPLALASKSIIALKEHDSPADVMPKTIPALSELLSEIKEVKSEMKSQVKTAKEEEKISQTQPLQSLLKSLNEVSANGAEVHKESPKESLKEAPKVVSAPDVLSALLRGNNESDNTETKVGTKTLEEPNKTLHIHKADSLEVKSKEAVQSMRHFAIDLKEAAENYKPPFTRVMMKLNPEKLGEVEVTLVQRGNNVHVNIQSSNASSVAFLAHNATELKAQLAHQGITNATMNFMSGGENQHQNPQQQQQHNRFQAYESLQELEVSQQELSALEIILPHYA